MSDTSELPEKNKSAAASRPDGQVGKDSAGNDQIGKKKSSPPVSDLHFYSSREERLAMTNAHPKPASTAKKGFFKKNMLLIIVLIDVLLISVILLFNKGVVHLPSNAAAYKQELGGYSFSLQGLQLKDKLIASLSVKKTKAQTDVTGLLYVRFSGKKEVVLSSIELPAIKDEEQELTATLFEDAGNKLLKAEITLGKEIILLSRKISNE